MTTITIDPGELKKAAAEVADRVEAAIRAGRALHRLNLSVEMPPFVQGKVRGLVEGAADDLTAASARIGGLSGEMLARSGQAERADEIGKMFGGLLNAAGIKQSSLEMSGKLGKKGKPLFTTGLSGDALKWVKWAGKGLKVTQVLTAGVVSWNKHQNNPWLTAAQRDERIIAETGASAGKMAITTAVGAGAAGAAMGSVVPVAGTVAGAAVGFVAGLAGGVIAGTALHFADKLGMTESIVDDFERRVDALRAARDWTETAAGDVVDTAGNVLPKVVRPPLPILPIIP